MGSAESLPDDRDSISHRAAFDFVRYANCWEDADILIEALRPAPGHRVLSIASAGDNALALLAAGADVIAVDLNSVQLACLELRCAAFRNLDYPDLLGFLGVHETDDRLPIYRRLATELSDVSRRFWDTRPAAVAGGIIHAGRFENYFRLFRTRVLPLIHSRKTVSRLLQPKDRAGRREFWEQTWNNRRWRLLFRLFFGRFVMGRLGRDPEFFRYVEGSIGDRLLERVRCGLTELRTDDNPFLHYIATGNFGSALPRYLRPEHFDAIRCGLTRLTLCHNPIEVAGQQHVGPGFDAFNLSDIFEYVEASSFVTLYRKLLALARPQARFAYWNTLVPRSCPEELGPELQPLKDLSRELFARDRAFFYCHFEVDEFRR